MKKILGVIPSRLQSSRLKEKPLFKVLGIPLILHVYFRAKLCNKLDDLIVATDSTEILDLVTSFGGKAMLTSVSHKNGTERIAEVMDKYPYDYYTLINGDEILLNPSSIDISIDTLLGRPDADASLLTVPFDRFNSPSDFKVVCNTRSEVMYISRNDIPSSARNPVDQMKKAYHLMTFKPETLEQYRQMEKTPLELIEDHEHLRLIESGFKIVTKTVNDKCISLDTIEDLPLIQSYLEKDEIYKKYSTMF